MNPENEAGVVAPLISVVIPHFRDFERLDICLGALQKQTLSPDDFEIIVADNASPEGEARVADVVAGRARLVVVPERGAGPARNGGVQLARGEILAFTDSDCVPEPQWLAEGVAALDRYDFAGGRVRVLVEDPEHVTPTEAFERVFAFDFKSYITRKGFTGSGNLFCRRSLFDDVGGFRTGVSEDMDWSFRARAKGYSLGYAPKAVVGHPARRTWDELWAKWRRVDAETYGLLGGKSGWARWLARCAALPASALAHTPRVLLSSQLETLGQRLGALGVLYRLRVWRSADYLRLFVAGGRGS